VWCVGLYSSNAVFILLLDGGNGQLHALAAFYMPYFPAHKTLFSPKKVT
jgi:hypothetical protein